MNVPEISVQELKELLGKGADIALVDVRESPELQISALPNSHHLPLSQFVARMQELDPNRDIVVFCRSGHRSADVTEYLLHLGFKQVRNLAGGINEWAREIDPSMSTY